jgi:hypothetical protein
MSRNALKDTIDERLERIGPIVTRIEYGGGEADLHDLRLHLIDVIGAISRDPGVEAAMEDLYDAALALVKDGPVGLQPMARKRRLLRDAHQRFRVRLKVATRTIADEDPAQKRTSAPCDGPIAIPAVMSGIGAEYAGIAI